MMAFGEGDAMNHLPFKNYMEDVVGDMLTRLAAQYPDVCMCDR